MIYGSVCSGIEAASVAWDPLGWRPAFFSEIAGFPRRVLADRFPSVPLRESFVEIVAGDHDPIELLVGGTPCQSFSVAGLGKGLADDRGNLALEYCLLADRLRPRWVVWENVPGVLSNDGGRAFASILSGLVRWDIRVPRGGWKAAGIAAPAPVDGAFGVAWRVLDAQFVRVDGYPYAVPQRRRRLFVVGYSGDWRRAAAVLFERAGLSGDPAPRREAGQNVAPTLSARTQGGGGLGSDTEVDGGLVASGGGNTAGPITAAATLTAGVRRQDFDTETLIAFDETQITSGENRSRPKPGGPSHPLSAGARPPAIAFSCKDHRADASVEVSATLRAMGHDGSHANAGGQMAIAYGIRADASREGIAKTPSKSSQGRPSLRNPGIGISEGLCPTLDTAQAHAIAYGFNARQDPDAWRERAGPLDTDSFTQAAFDGWQVRRLTPLECERLQGFPDGWTTLAGLSGWREVGDDESVDDLEAQGFTVRRRGDSNRLSVNDPDGPRYKALGNSMAVNVMRWIGRRIAEVDAL